MRGRSVAVARSDERLRILYARRGPAPVWCAMTFKYIKYMIEGADYVR
jgi:hypothetical protein